MGQRANLILIERGQREMYYTHWRANTLDRDLFWGPDHAARFIRAQQARTHWLDEVWAEGGAVLDRDAHVLLMFGGEDVRIDVSLRRVYLDLLRHVWSGWDVRWAYEGIADVADYVGHPREAVLTNEFDPAKSRLTWPRRRPTAGPLRSGAPACRTARFGSFRWARSSPTTCPLARHWRTPPARSRGVTHW
jgi:hypothetical protein